VRALVAALTWTLLLRQARAASAAWQIAAAYPEAQGLGNPVSIADNKVIPAARPASNGARAFEAPSRPSPARKWPQYLTPGCARIRRNAVHIRFTCVLAPVLQMQLPNMRTQQVVLGGQPTMEQSKSCFSAALPDAAGVCRSALTSLCGAAGSARRSRRCACCGWARPAGRAACACCPRARWRRTAAAALPHQRRRAERGRARGGGPADRRGDVPYVVQVHHGRAEAVRAGGGARCRAAVQACVRVVHGRAQDLAQRDRGRERAELLRAGGRRADRCVRRACALAPCAAARAAGADIHKRPGELHHGDPALLLVVHSMRCASSPEVSGPEAALAQLSHTGAHA